MKGLLDTANPRPNKILLFSVVFLWFFAIGFFIVGSASYNVPLDTSASGLMSTSEPYLSVTFPQEISFGLVDPSAGDKITIYEDLQVETNNPLGAIITVAPDPLNTCMRHTSVPDTTDCTDTPVDKKFVLNDFNSLQVGEWSVDVDSDKRIEVAVFPGMHNSVGYYNGQLTVSAMSIIPPPPEIYTATPESGWNGDLVNITGKYFDTTYEVKVGDADCTNADISGAGTRIMCEIPPGNVGETVNVTVRTWGGVAVFEDAFTYAEVFPTNQWVVSSYDDIGGESANDFEVQRGNNLIPVTNQSTSGSTTANWANYDERQWGNAVTLIDSKTGNSYDADGTVYTNGNGQYTPREYFRDIATKGEPIPDADITGFFVWIPRYAYQVMRYSTANHAICGDGTSSAAACANVGATNFEIKFQKPSDPKLDPTPNSTVGDYRTLVPAENRWYTHPTFTFGETELAGIWVGKFEATGSVSTPTVRPLESSLRNQAVSAQFNTARTLGTNHGLDEDGLDTRMAKNLDWGAVAYLTTSMYGRGVLEMHINNCNTYKTGIAGASPDAAASATTCNNADNYYYGEVGIHGSTTSNVYGIYDMSGGAQEYLLANYSNGAVGRPASSGFTAGSGAQYFAGIDNKYFDLYRSTIFSNDDQVTNLNQCTFAACGGMALFETLFRRPANGTDQSWNNNHSTLARSALPWVRRGGTNGAGQNGGIFFLGNFSGAGEVQNSFRVVTSEQ